MGIGVGIAFIAYMVSSALFVGLVWATGHSSRTSDVGDIFDKAGKVAEWSVERLDAAAKGAPLPDPPELYADIRSLQFGLGTTLLYDAALVATVGIVARQQGFRELARTFRLNTFRAAGLWRPALVMVATYLAVVTYAVVVDALGLDALKPVSTVPEAVTRDNLTAAMAGVLALVAAPFSEELFFRGLVFTCLLRWGTGLAFVASALLFSAVHLDVGSLIPFFFVGLALNYLYWYRGNLWESIAFHFFFNGASFAILMAQR